MSYFALLFKKIRCKWLNMIPILLVCVFLIVVYVGALKSMQSSFENGALDKEKIQMLEKEITLMEDEIKTYEMGSDDYQSNVDYMDAMREELALLQKRLSAYEIKDWKTYYACDEKLNELLQTKIATQQEVYHEDYKNAIKTNIKYAHFMRVHELSFDDRWKPIQGISFMVHVVNAYLPVILAALVIFIVSILYCFSYKDNMNIHYLIPMNRMKQESTKLFTGVFCGFLIIAFFVTFLIGCGTIGCTLGSLQTPVLTYSLNDINDYIPFMDVLLPFIILLTLSIFFIVNLVSLLSWFTKKRMLCMMIALIIVLGGMWMTTNIVPLAPYVHLLPTTYISALKVISAEMMQATNNGNVNFMNGVIVLVLSNIILFGLHYYGEKLHIRKGSL